MSFKEYDEFSAGPMRLPIKGKVYEIPEVGYEAGVMLQKVESGDAPDLAPEDQWRLLMGPAFDEMIADKVPSKALERAILACLTDYRLGREIAESVWEAGLDPEAFAPKGATEQGSTSTGEETKTPTPASMTGMSSPKTSTKTKAPKAQRSRKSSPTST